MRPARRIFFLITNDLNYDQRMHRICSSLQKNGYQVSLVGTSLRGSKKLRPAIFHQIRIRCIFKSGKLFYLEYSFKVLFILFFSRFDAICAVDLDTVLPAFILSRLKGKQRIYDAHELFCELPEIISRPGIRRKWKWLEKKLLPYFPQGYAVSDSISREYQKMYGHHYITIRNMPELKQVNLARPISGSYILYQGTLNEGRGMEYLLPAMKHIPLPLVICGEGNFSSKARSLVDELNLHDKVQFQGMIEPDNLSAFTANAVLGLNLGDPSGLNNYLSLNNKFFDYIHADLPQLAMNFPEFKKINDAYEVAVLLENLNTETIAANINQLLKDEEKYQRIKSNCKLAKLQLNWKEEEKKLTAFYNDRLPLS